MTALGFIFVLLAIGIVLLIGELFLPTHGLLGVVGLLALVIAVGETLLLNQFAGVALLAAMLIATPFAWAAAMRIWPKTPIGRKMILPPVVAIPDPPAIHLGQTGRALSELRPMGVCDFAGRKVEATSQIGMIEAGRTVTVTSINNRRPVVRAV